MPSPVFAGFTFFENTVNTELASTKLGNPQEWEVLVPWHQDFNFFSDTFELKW